MGTALNKKIVVLGLFLSFLFISHSAQALTVSPVRLEVSGDPGQTLKVETLLINETTVPETLYSSYSNFEAQGESGNPSFVEPKDDLGTWMKAPESVELKPGETKIVPVTITIPTNADPGGHFAVVFWGTTSPKNPATNVGVGSKTGILILLRVNGDVSEQGGILEFDTVGKERFYTSLPVTFYYRFQNNGGDRIKPTGEVVMKNMLHITSAKIPGNPVEGNILPGSTRKIETTWQGKTGPKPVAPEDQGNFFNKVSYEWKNFAFGYYKATINLAYGTQNQVSTGTVGFWVFPWHLTIFVVVAAVILYFILKKAIKSYNRWVIKKAEEMLKKEQGKEESQPKR